jgi:WD40 repeat protein
MKEDGKLAEGMKLHHAAPVVNTHFATNGSRLVTVTQDDFAIWDTTTGAQMYMHDGPPNILEDAVLFPDGRHLFLANCAFGDSLLWDIVTEVSTCTANMIQAASAALAPLHHGILIASWDVTSWDNTLRGAIQLLDDETVEIRRTYSTMREGRMVRVLVSPDGGSFLALQGCFNEWTKTVEDDEIFLFDIETGLIQQRYSGPKRMTDIAFVPDEPLVAASTQTGVCWWDSATGDVVREYRSSHGPITSLDFTPNGKMVAIGCENGKVLLLQWPKLQEVRRFSDQTKRINRLAFSPDGYLLASASDDEVAYLWRIAP